MKREIPFFNYPRIFTDYEDDLIKIFRDVGRRGAYILQRDLEYFEKSLASFLNVKYAVGVGNCTDGLTIALKAAGISPGDEVIFSSHTFVATAEAIKEVGAIPVPVECGDDHLIDPNDIKNKITPKTKAIMPTHLNGRTANMDEIMKIASEHGLMIIEDAAQAVGAKFKGKCAGTFGIAAAVSFYPAKSLGCLGDGGAVLTNDDEIYEKLVLLRDHGRDKTGEVKLWACNTRLDNLQAAFLSFFLEKYPDSLKKRRKLAGIYHDYLSKVEKIKLPPPPFENDDRFDIFQNYEIEAENRDELKKFLAENGIGTAIQWGGKAVHQFKALKFNVSLPYTEKIFKKLLLLPINQFLSEDDVIYICDTIKKFYK